MKSLLKQIDLNDIKENNYLKKSFETRIYVLLSNIYLNENELELSREYAKKRLNQLIPNVFGF